MKTLDQSRLATSNGPEITTKLQPNKDIALNYFNNAYFQVSACFDERTTDSS